MKDRLGPFLNQDHVVVMDNAAFRKLDETRQIIRGKGATLLYLPPYSPYLNPIAHDFAALKKIREFNHQLSIGHIVSGYQQL
ncbi:MAG TPA: transposase [Micavibrio sp.]